MKSFRQFILPGVVFLMAAFAVSCDEDGFENSTDADDAQIPLTVADTSIKVAGRGQYRLKTLSGEQVQVKVDLSGLAPVNSLSIKKTKNTVTDETFGTNGTLTVNGNAAGESYLFTYTPGTSDIDQLIGFTFEAQGSNGQVLVSDLTLMVTLSPRDNIPQKKWALTSRLWVDGGNAQDLKDCEKDNFTYWNVDGSMSVDYGADTGAGDCVFDGFDIFHSWELTEDEELFIVTKSGLFDPTVKTDTYRVVSLTTEKLVMDIDFDLTAFGFGPEETFRYEYTAFPK